MLDCIKKWGFLSLAVPANVFATETGLHSTGSYGI